MNISYNWLKDLVETDLPPRELAEKLTRVGLAVEGIHAHGDDFVLDVDLTSNRGDCLSHLGVARELATITNSQLRMTNLEMLQNSNGAENLLMIQDADLCHRFTARVIRNVKISASPEWLVKRLEAIGERSVNNVADITNYVMHELGNPMHSFDFNKLVGNRIIVRRARNGETITTLDEVERKLDDTMLAICDAEKPVAVAGVMGGLDSSITDATTDVLLEVAYFDRENIRQTSRKLKLSTEASHHFERGVDIENLIYASNRATELICELSGGEAGEFVDVYPTKFERKQIESPGIQSAVKRLTKLEVQTSEIERILSALGIENKSETIFVAPTWRHDLANEEDLVEEVARIVGYDQIGEDLPPAFGAGEYQPTESRKKSLRKALVQLGFNEAISYSFIDAKNDGKFELIPNLMEKNSDEKYVTLADSIIEGAIRMRPTLLPGLLDAVRTNFNFQRRDLKLFEIGKVFSASLKENDLPNERELLAIAVTGSELLQSKASALRELSFYDAKGALETAVEAMKLPALKFELQNIRHLRSGQTAEISFNNQAIGAIGRLCDEISAEYKFRQPVYVAEIDLQMLLKVEEQKIVYHPLPIYPSSTRDVSLLVKRNVGFDDIQLEIAKQNYELCRNVEFVDVYEGKGISDDERSITIRLEYRSDERTLLEEEVERIHLEILNALEKNLSAKPRF